MRAEMEDGDSGSGGLLGPLATLVLACGLSWWFFPVLWLGGGLIGGDLYPYFLPQKTAYADALSQGRIPLWNQLVGHGYPQLAESQTGVFYPPHLIAYSMWDVNTAYVLMQLLHYVMAFCGMTTLARGLGLGRLASWLSATVFVYGWFPARLCLEWAILGGAWLPWAVFGMDQWSRRRLWRYAFLAWAALGLQLLAGHFVIAFITLILIVVWASLRWFSSGTATQPRCRDWSPVPGVALVIVGAFLASAIQLVPTWEYKRLSQRQAGHVDFDPGYGAIPWRYLAQVVTPWSSYSDPRDINDLRAGHGSLTNRVEAHLYFGLLPLLLLVAGCGLRCLPRRGNPRPQPPAASSESDDFLALMWWPLIAVAAVATLHATGLISVLTNRLPGFGFFTGPGRFGLLTTFIVALLSARFLDGFAQVTSLGSGSSKGVSLSRWTYPLAGVVILATTIADLAWVAARVGYAAQVITPPVQFRDRSPLRDYLRTLPDPPRLFCRGANVATLLGVASTPTYLGLSPAAYTDPALRMPEPLPFDLPPDPAHISWLRRTGVTHILSFTPLDQTVWPVNRVGAFDDPMLNLAWGRYGGTDQPLFFLYELTETRGRVAWEVPAPGNTARVTHSLPERIQLEATNEHPGRLILTELAYPGWNVTINDLPGQPQVADQMFRAVDLPAGRHQINWTYQPASFRIGATVSILTILMAAALGHVRFWHPYWIDRAFALIRSRRKTADHVP